MDITDRDWQETMQRNSTPLSSHDVATEVQGFPIFSVEFNDGQTNHRGSQESDKMILMENSGPLNRDQDPCKHTHFYPAKMQPNQLGANFYPTVNLEPHLPIGDRAHCVPFNMFSLGHLHGSQLQDFQCFVVIDFEATCDKEKIPQPQEIIEFPSVLVNSRTGQLEASFQTYVRPVYHQTLTDFCKDLTGIQQNQVNGGVFLGKALFMHDRWLEGKGIKHTNFAVVTWSNWDCRVMLESECRFKRIRKPPYFDSFPRRALQSQAGSPASWFAMGRSCTFWS